MSETTRHYSALHSRTQEDYAVSWVVCRSHFTRFVREIKKTSNGKQKGRPAAIGHYGFLVSKWQRRRSLHWVMHLIRR